MEQSCCEAARPGAAPSRSGSVAKRSATKSSDAPSPGFSVEQASPIVMACPCATILSLDASPPGPVDYDDLEHVKFMRTFLANPKAFVERLRAA